MNCDWAKENMTLYLYNELADDARHELEQHLERCAACAAELKALRGFHADLSALPQLEPTPNLLAASRMRLQDALESAHQSRSWRWTLDLANWLHQARFAPALAVILLMFGFGGGVMATYWITGRQPVDRGPAVVTGSPQAQQSSIAGIRAIVPHGGNNVEIQYDTVQPENVQGSVDDPKIQQLLLFAARSNLNSGVRMDSVDLLAQKPEDQRVREALMYALRYDNNPGVRLKALDGLGPYVTDDIAVRNAVLEALINDSNPGVRSEAITLLKSCRADGTVRETLRQLSRQDKNQYIRSESKRVLASIPEID